ncbi:MAG TPA: amidase [Pyrinomonadaceae bacterium]|nr:amidase [Pyrinomonadaceae bacterium]
MDELIYASATSLAQAIRDREVSSEEVVGAILERIESVNPKINAVVQLRAEAALAEARSADSVLARGETKGPLHGIPITLKDALETAGIVSTAGTKGRASFVPAEDETAVARMRAAGAIVLGKTNVPELSLAFESDNLIYGRTNNPYDLMRTPGGSSGGEAAIIAAGGSPLGLGTDLAGSIRLPSHFCGIAGLKPTTGRVPKTAHFPPRGGLTTDLSQAGPMARRVEDLALALPVIAGVDWRDPTVVPMPLGDPSEVDAKSLRVAFHTDNGIATPTPETVLIVKDAARSVTDAGASVDEARPDGIEETYELMHGLLGADGGAGVQTLLKIAGTLETHPLLQRVQELLRPRAITTVELGALLLRLYRFRSRMLSFMEHYDAIISPVCVHPAMLHGHSFNEETGAAFSYTMTYNLTGWPSVVVRGGTSPEGLPIGVQIVARPWREDVALALAARIEQATGGFERPLL